MSGNTLYILQIFHIHVLNIIIQKTDIQYYPTIIRFFIGNDKGHFFTPFDQFYIYHKDDIRAQLYAQQSMKSFEQQWKDINSSAILTEVTQEILTPHKINAGPWMESFKHKSLCTPKPFHVPQYITEAQQTLREFEQLLHNEWINPSVINYEHTDHIILDNEIFQIGENETWRGNKLSELIEQSKHLSYVIKRTANSGLSLYTQSYIPKNTLLFEYTGELLDIDDAIKRDDETYQFWCGKEYKIDAKYKGNYSRFINHICDGKHSSCNLAIDIIEETGLDGFFRIILYSKKNIQPGTELLFNYRSGTVKRLNPKNQFELKNKILCNCPCASMHSSYPFVF